MPNASSPNSFIIDMGINNNSFPCPIPEALRHLAKDITSKQLTKSPTDFKQQKGLNTRLLLVFLAVSRPCHLLKVFPVTAPHHSVGTSSADKKGNNSTMPPQQISTPSHT